MNLLADPPSSTDETPHIASRRLPLDNPVQPEAIEAMRSIRFRIPANTIARAITGAIDRRLVNLEQAKAIEWFAGYCRNKNLGREEMNCLLTKGNGQYYSYDSIYQLLTGRRGEQGASILPIVDAINTFKAIIEPASRVTSTGFINTRMSRAVFDRLDRARKFKKIAFIFGDSHIGKSECIAEYTRYHNHGETISIDTPDTPSLPQVKRRLARTLALSNANRPSDLGEAIEECFREGKLLIFDNFHRVLRLSSSHKVCDFIQGIFDSRKIGIGIFMTNEGRDLLTNGPHRKRYEQLWKRRIAPLQLPNMLPADDLALFAKARGLSPAPDGRIGVTYSVTDAEGNDVTDKFSGVPRDIQNGVVSAEGLGIWISILDLAVDLAAKDSRPADWHYVLKAFCIDRAQNTIWS